MGKIANNLDALENWLDDIAGGYDDLHTGMAPVFIVTEARNEIYRLETQVKALQKLCDAALHLVTHGDYRNGVTDQSGMLDEGTVRAAEMYDRLQEELKELST